MRLWGFTAALPLVILVGGCAGNGLAQPAVVDNPEASVTLIVPDQQSEYFRAVRAGAIESARNNDVRLTIPAGASTPAEQIAAVTDALTRGEDGIAIAPVSVEVDAALSAARSAGVKIVEIGGTGIEIGNKDFTVQTDDCVLGLAAGQWLAGRMPEGSIFWPDFTMHLIRVVGSTGDYPRPTCRDSGFLQGLNIDPAVIANTPMGSVPTGVYAGGDVQFTAPCTVVFEGDMGKVTEDVQACVAAHPEVNAAYASSGDLAQATGDGLRFAGKTVGVDVMLTTVGGTGPALGLAEGSWVNATARPRVKATGGSAISSLVELINGQTPQTQGGKEFLDTGVDLCSDAAKTSVFVAVSIPIRECSERLSELSVQ